MKYWQQADGTKSVAVFQAADGRVLVETGTWPTRDDLSVWVSYNVRNADDTRRSAWARAKPMTNGSPTCSWRVDLGPFCAEAVIEYAVISRQASRECFSPWFKARVGPRQSQHGSNGQAAADGEPVADLIGGCHARR